MRGCRRVVTLDAWESVPPGNETALMQAVSQHPVAVGMCCGDYLDVRSLLPYGRTICSRMFAVLSMQHAWATPASHDLLAETA